MRITCKCGGKRYATIGPDTTCIYYKCNQCNTVFVQSKRGRSSRESTKSLIIILEVLSMNLREAAKGIDAAMEAIKEEYNKDVRIPNGSISEAGTITEREDSSLDSRG